MNPSSQPSPQYLGSIGASLHTQAWQLAQHGGDRIQRSQSPMLSAHIPTREFLVSETSAWETERNTNKATVDWRFTTADARIKLKRLYPVVHFERMLKKLYHQIMIYKLLVKKGLKLF